MKKPRNRYNDTDWSMVDIAIARKLGVHPSSVNKKRKSLGLEQPKPRARTGINWRQIPVGTWETKNDRQIAETLGCSRSTVCSMRKLHFRHIPRPRHTSRRWGHVDWAKRDEELASEMGVSTAAASSARSRYGKKGLCQRKPGKNQKKMAAMLAKLSERKTVHEWLNASGIPQEEDGRKLCLLRRLRITMDRYQAMQEAFNRIYHTTSCTEMQIEIIASVCPQDSQP